MSCIAADYDPAIVQEQAIRDHDPQQMVAIQVRSLEALRCAGIVKRVTEGLWMKGAGRAWPPVQCVTPEQCSRRAEIPPSRRGANSASSGLPGLTSN